MAPHLSAIGALVALILSALSPAGVQAGAWTPKKGTSYNKLAFNSYSTGSSFDAPAPDFRRFRDRNVTYYLEYGLTDTRTLFASLPVKRLTNESTNGTRAGHTGVGDIDIGLRQRLYFEGRSVLSASFLFKAPYAYKKSEAVPPGNGQEDLEARLQYGRSLGRYGYLGLEAGYRVRFDAPSDEYRYLLEYGFNASEKLYLRGKLDGIASARNGDATPASLTNPTLRNEFDLGKLELTAGLKLGRGTSGEFSVTRDLYGNNTLRGTNYSLAVVFAY